LLQSVISPDSLLVSNEINKTRVNILIENISKWGCNNVVITNNEAKDFQRLPGYFDIIVVDAPCSGSGLFRKDAATIDEWSTGNVEMCANRQQKILKEVLPALKEGGILIYSTCSYSEEENEEIADWLFDQALNPLQLKLHPHWNIVERFSGKHKAPGYRFYPDKLLGEGFFIAAFKKVNDTMNPVFKKNKFQLLSQKEKDVISPFINQSILSEYINWQGDILAIPQNRLNDLAMIQSVLYIKKAGVMRYEFIVMS
jgi:16S rRNA C967 or C1407 C5-methylase (RsmB/RsmF family)